MTPNAMFRALLGVGITHTHIINHIKVSFLNVKE